MAYVLIFCLIVALIVLSIFVVMDMYGNKYILDMKDLPIDCDTVIILFDILAVIGSANLVL